MGASRSASSSEGDRVWAIVLAGGNGTRFGQRKQFAPLAGKPVVAWSIDRARQVCDGVVVVLPASSSPPTSCPSPAPGPADPVGPRHPAGRRDPIGETDLTAAVAAALRRADIVVPGGVRRSDSVRAGLAVVPDDVDVIAVHDAARPLAGLDVWAAVLDAVAKGADGAVPVVPVIDTVTRVEPDGGRSAVDRTVLRAVQTPQAFRAGILRLAHEAGDDATDDASLVEAVGGRVVLVDGVPVNLKVTTRSDLVIAAALLAEGHGT